MSIILMSWGVITFVILILSIPFLRHQIDNQSIKPWKRSIYKNEKNSTVSIIFKEAILSVFIGCVLYVILNSCNDIIILVLVKWCQTTFIVAFFPIILNWMPNSENKKLNGWYILLVIIGLGLSIFTYLINEVEKINVLEYKSYFCICLSVFLALLAISLTRLVKNWKQESSEHLLSLNKSHIYKDLFNRTPTINYNNMNFLEQARLCEYVFENYFTSLNKIKGIESIEYCTLYGKYRVYWYNEVAIKMKAFWGFSFICSVFAVYKGLIMEGAITILLNLIFATNILLLKKFDLKFACRLAIRYFYDEWGYLLKANGNSRFIGHVAVWEHTKYHKYIHSVLNIVALCRAATYCTSEKSTSNIGVIRQHMLELCNIYVEKTSKWDDLLPLWVAALFEYHNQIKIGDIETKFILRGSINEENRGVIQTFLAGLWVDVIRRMPEQKDGEFIKNFFDEICSNE